MGMFTRLFCFVLLPFLVSNKDIITVLKELKTEMKMVNRRLTQVEQKLDAVDIDKVNKELVLVKAEGKQVSANMTMIQSDFVGLESLFKSEVKTIATQFDVIQANFSSDLHEVRKESAMVKEEFVTVKNMSAKANKAVDEAKKKLDNIAQTVWDIKDKTMRELKSVTTKMDIIEANVTRDVQDLQQEAVVVRKEFAVVNETQKKAIDAIAELKHYITELVADTITDLAKKVINIGDLIKNMTSNYQTLNRTYTTDIADLKKKADQVMQLTSKLNHTYVADFRQFKEEAKEVNQTVLNLQTALNKDVETIDKNLTSLEIHHREDIKQVTAEIFRYYQLDKIIRFIWPRFGTEEENNHYIWGYVEINHAGKWGSICDHGFDDRDANVTCKTAGFKGGVFDNKKYDQNDVYKGKAPLRWLTDLQCNGTEINLNNCTNIHWGDVPWSCTRDNDVGVKCYI